jgi:hypothetical protein
MFTVTECAFQEIDLVHARLNTLANLRLPRFANSLKKLCLRQNFLRKIEEDSFTPLIHLEDLDLYDNQIKHVGQALEKLPLRYVCVLNAIIPILWLMSGAQNT